jgi:hypothetical protein
MCPEVSLKQYHATIDGQSAGMHMPTAPNSSMIYATAVRWNRKRVLTAIVAEHRHKISVGFHMPRVGLFILAANARRGKHLAKRRIVSQRQLQALLGTFSTVIDN